VTFIDSNIPMYVAGADHLHKASATRFLESVAAGRVDACTSTEVLQEILFRYAGMARLDLARKVYGIFVRVCPVVLPVELPDTDLAVEILDQVPGVSVRDALHAAVMRNHGVEEIATFDRGFARIPGITIRPLA
jgi:predicted nucleic acid-binding protein